MSIDGIISTILAIITGVSQRKRHIEQIHAEAKKFIQKYNQSGDESDIYLLPLCVAAYKYNPIYPYRRPIYRDFCILSEEVQNAILALQNIELKSKKEEQYYQKLLNKLRNLIKIYCPGDMDIYYEGGKYLHRALLSHGNRREPNLTCQKDEDSQYAKGSTMYQIQQRMSEMCTPYMQYLDHITNLLAYHAAEKPITHLWYEETNMGTPDKADEIIPAYLCCEIAIHVSIASDHGDCEARKIGHICDYNGDRYMEDLFLEALHTIENCNINEK